MLHHILIWFLQHLPLLTSGSMMLLAAGGGTVVLPDTSTAGIETAEGGTEGAEGTEGGVEGDTESTESAEAVEGTEVDQTAAPEKDEKIDWRTVPQEVKAHIQETAKTNPKLANLMQNAVYTSQTFLKEFPGGLKEAQGIKKSIEELGGLEEVKNLKSTHRALEDEQERMDSMARSGDPAVLDNLMEIAGGEGFVKLMPTALGRWSSSDPDSYSHTMAKIMVSAMQDSGVVANINMAFKMLGLNNPEATKVAVEELQKVATWANNINKLSTKAPEKPKVDPELAKQQQDIASGRQKLFNDQFSNKFVPWRASKIQELLKSVAPKDRKFSDFQMSTLTEKVASELESILTSDPEYMKSLQRVYDSKNMAELLKFTQSRADKHLPEVVKKVYRSLYTEATLGSKKKVATAAKGKEEAAKPNEKGWVKVSLDKAPRPDEIDRTKTDFKMGFNKQAILKNGQKVFWGEKVPA